MIVLSLLFGVPTIVWGWQKNREKVLGLQFYGAVFGEVVVSLIIGWKACDTGLCIPFYVLHFAAIFHWLLLGGWEAESLC